MKTGKLLGSVKQVVLGLALLACVPSFAQKGMVTSPFFSVNLKGGVNLSQIKTNAGTLNSVINESLNTKTGYVFGANLRVGRKLFIQPEVLFSQKGGEVKSVINNVITGFDMQYTTLDLPLLLGYKFGHFYILAGPSFSNQISENNGLDQAISSVYSSWKSGEGYKKSTLNYQLGAGVTLLGLTLDVRYETGQNIFNSNTTLNLEQKPSLFQATLGVKIL